MDAVVHADHEAELEPPPVEHAIPPDPDQLVLGAHVLIPADPGESNPDHVDLRRAHPDPSGYEVDEDIFYDAFPASSQSGSNSSTKQFDLGGHTSQISIILIMMMSSMTLSLNHL